MASRATFWLRLLSITLLGLILLGVAVAAFAWPALKRHYGIEQLQWHGLALSLREVRVQHLQIKLRAAEGAQLHAEAEAVILHWRWRAPAVRELQLGRLRLDWQPAPDPQPSATTPFNPDLASYLPRWLPQRLQVQQFDASLPCASGRCLLSGALELHNPEPAPLQLTLTLQHQEHQLGLQAKLSREPLATQLQAQLTLDQQPRLHLRSDWQIRTGAPQWSGDLELPQLPESAWLLAWLEQWLGPQPRLSHAPDLQLHANWQLRLPPGALQWASLAHASGQVSLNGQLPVAWPLPEVGQLQGQWALELVSDQGQWRARQLQADVTLSAIPPQLLSAIPPELHPQSLQLRLQPDPDATPLNDNALPLQVWLSSTGALKLQAQARLQWLANPDSWALQIEQSRWQASLERLTLNGVAARDLQADLQLSGQLNLLGAELTLAPDAHLSLEQLDAGGLRLEGTRLSSGALQIGLGLPADAPSTFQLKGPLRLEIQKLQQEQLQPLRWEWQGQVQADRNRVDAQGTLHNSGGLVANLGGQRLASGDLQLQAKSQEMFLRTGNPLAATLKAWPPLLQLNNGRLRLSGDYALSAKGQHRASADLQLLGVAGLYDRSELEGLSATLHAKLTGDALQLNLTQAQLERLHSGIGLGPLTLQAQYAAQLSASGQGRLQWQQLSSAFLGGRLWLEPGSLHLGQTNPALPLHIQGLQLEELFRAYPAEGLSGQGALDGELPLTISAEGIRVIQGTLAARAPGGVLAFASPRINALGSSNPAMKLVVDALGNFHYSHLSSGVSYDPQGKLLLNLRLEGRNPNLEGGRPINFNINLEEDIPALLTSLQLTDRVSDRVRQRVQDRLSRPETSAPLP